MRQIVLVVCVALLAWCGAARADCPITGLYTGTAKTTGGTNAEATLNLDCKDGSPAAQLFTSMGDFEVKAVSATAGHLKVAFDSGASLGTLELDAKGDSLSGTVELAGDRGTAAFIRKGEAMAKDAWKPRLDLTPAQWREDIAYYERELPRRHANAFFHISRTEFEKEVRALAQRAASANGDEMFVGLQQITKSIGDGHTGIFALGMDRRVMPITVAKFGPDLRIVEAGPAYEKLLGTRIVKIGGEPIADVWAKVMTLSPQAEF
jgi:hypothetical protein